MNDFEVKFELGKKFASKSVLRAADISHTRVRVELNVHHHLHFLSQWLHQRQNR